MEIHLWTSKRDQIIAIGHTLGKAFAAHPRVQPWTVCLNGDVNSGKSLIALAVDQAFHPHLYPLGLKSDISADGDLAKKPGKVAFTNYFANCLPRRRKVDKALDDFNKKFPKADVLIASNLESAIVKETFSRATGDLTSKRRDVSIYVFRICDFNRQVTLNLPENDFGKNLKERLLVIQNKEDLEPIGGMIELYEMTDIPRPPLPMAQP